jgi:hypothetical protein
MVLHSQAEGL